jgi:hypothetical protein
MEVSELIRKTYHGQPVDLLRRAFHGMVISKVKQGILRRNIIGSVLSSRTGRNRTINAAKKESRI